MLLKLISYGSLALVSVLVVTLLQGFRQHNQRIQALKNGSNSWRSARRTVPSVTCSANRWM